MSIHINLLDRLLVLLIGDLREDNTLNIAREATAEHIVLRERGYTFEHDIDELNVKR